MTRNTFRAGRLLASVAVLLTAGAILAMPAHAVPVEKGQEKYVESVDPKALDALAKIIRVYGYRCDSISSAFQFVFSRGYTVKCNHHAYTYEVKDRGGTWVATLAD